MTGERGAVARSIDRRHAGAFRASWKAHDERHAHFLAVHVLAVAKMIAVIAERLAVVRGTITTAFA